MALNSDMEREIGRGKRLDKKENPTRLRRQDQKRLGEAPVRGYVGFTALVRAF
jgi:hypothetical protein